MNNVDWIAEQKLHHIWKGVRPANMADSKEQVSYFY